MATQLKERPVIFTAEEVSAVLVGDKTQHRVPVLTSEQAKDGFEWSMGGSNGDNAVFISDIDSERQKVLVKPSPFGVVGCRLWVQEMHQTLSWSFEDGEVTLLYLDGEKRCLNYLTEEELENNPNDDYLIEICDELIKRGVPIKEGTDYFDFSSRKNLPDWRTADVMPRFASRLLLEITDIRIERVQDTSHDDAVAEGVHHFNVGAKLRDQPLSVAQVVFSRHWDDKYQDDHVIWEHNPWVWVVEFKKVDD